MYEDVGGGVAHLVKIPYPKPPQAAPPPPPTPAPAPPGVDPKTGFSGSNKVGNSGQHPWDTDPAYVAAQNSYNEYKAAQDAWLAEQRKQAQFGFNGAGNQFSYMAQLGRADADRIRAYKNSLAARGILQSGEYGYQAGQEALWRAQQQYAGEQQLLANLNNYLQQYTGNLQNARGSLDNALSQAYNNYLNNPDAYGHWSDPNSPAGYFQFTPTSYTDPRTGASLITEYFK